MWCEKSADIGLFGMSSTTTLGIGRPSERDNFCFVTLCYEYITKILQCDQLKWKIMDITLVVPDHSQVRIVKIDKREKINRHTNLLRLVRLVRHLFLNNLLQHPLWSPTSAANLPGPSSNPSECISCGLQGTYHIKISAFRSKRKALQAALTVQTNEWN